MKKERNLDELFREKLLNYEQEPPAYLLENILDGVAGAHRKRRLAYWRWTSVAAALLLAFVAGWELNNRSGREMNQFVVVDSQKPVHENPAEEITATGKVEAQDNLVSAKTQTKTTNTLSPKQSGTYASKATEDKALGNQGSVDEASSEKILALIPLKGLYRQLQPENKTEAALLQKRSVVEPDRLAEKSIDQQIMEHNSQMLMAENKTNGKVRWMVGAQISPEYNILRSSHPQTYASNMLASSSGSVDLGGGISVELKKGKRWSVQSGVYYSGISQSAKNSGASGKNQYMDAMVGSNYFNTKVNIDVSKNQMTMNSPAGVIELDKIPSGMVLGSSLEDKTAMASVIVSPTSFIQNFDYIEVPLYLRYTLIDARFDVVMLGGFSSNLLVGNQIFVEGTSGRSLVGKTKDMEALNYSGTLGLGFKYGLSKRMSINVEPRVKYFLKSLNANSSVTYKPYTIGIFTGLSYEF